jgi:hypothetical protein
MSEKEYTLLVTAGVRKGATYPVTSAGAKLGRSSHCDIEIPDPSLSRDHCCFEIRNGDLWVIDLASANQTLVNGKAVQEQKLAPADVITVGDTVLSVQPSSGQDGAPAFGADAPAGEAPAGAPVIDLGFKKEDTPDEASSRKSLLRPILWAVGAVLVLLLGVMFISDMGKRSAAPSAEKAAATDKTLLIEYEKIEATASSIFRYSMTLDPNGTLTVAIDDLGGEGEGKDRHLRKEKALSKATLADLTQTVEGSGFFTLEKSYTGFAAKENQLDEKTMTVALGKQARTCRVTNKAEPDLFKALREKLETFSKNELGIWAIQFSTDKLTELAKDALSVAAKKYEERDVRYGNLFEAIHSYQEAVFYLDTVNPKPAFYDQVINGFEAAEAELDTRYKEQRFKANRAINLSDWATAQTELKILCEMIPDREDQRNREASQKLLDVESRIKKR